MKKNVLNFGERSLEGEYGRVTSFGEIKIKNSSVKTLRTFGDASITASHIKKLRTVGNASASDCEFNVVKVLGETKLNGICKANEFTVTGGLKSEYLECESIRNCSVKNKRWSRNINLSDRAKWSGYIKARTFESDFFIDLCFEYGFENIITSGGLLSSDEIVCENFYGFGAVDAPGINAGCITIIPFSGTKIGALAGEKITVRRSFKPDRLYRSLTGSGRHKKILSDGSVITVTEIEGDSVYVENVNSERISGDNVVIGDLCVVGRVEYKSTISVSDRAAVGETVKI